MSTRRRLCGLGAIFLVTFFVLVGIFGAYPRELRDTGDPFTINRPRPDSHLIEKTAIARPGIESIAAGYFTFRFVDLLEHPWITNSVNAWPRHRTSLWTQLYGRTNSVHFAVPAVMAEQEPVGAHRRKARVRARTPAHDARVDGMFTASKRLVRPALEPPVRRSPASRRAVVVLTAFGYVAFVVQYTLRYRDFSTMKAEFLFPGLLRIRLHFGDEQQRAAVSVGSSSEVAWSPVRRLDSAARSVCSRCDDPRRPTHVNSLST